MGWFSRRILFVSWGRHWKGVYVHFLPRYCYRVFLWGIDRHPKAWRSMRGQR
jgi:hypothetical protein